MRNLYKVLRWSAALLGLLAIGVMLFGDSLTAMGPFVIGALVCLAIGGARCSGHPATFLHYLGICCGRSGHVLPAVFSSESGISSLPV